MIRVLLTPIGDDEKVDAATALVAGSELATLHVKEFSRVSGLQLAELIPFVRT